MTPERQILLQLGEMLHAGRLCVHPDYFDKHFRDGLEPYVADNANLIVLEKIDKLLALIEETAMSEEQNFVLTKLGQE